MSVRKTGKKNSSLDLVEIGGRDIPHPRNDPGIGRLFFKQSLDPEFHMPVVPSGVVS